MIVIIVKILTYLCALEVDVLMWYRKCFISVSLVSFQTKDNIVSIYRLFFELSSDNR